MFLFQAISRIHGAPCKSIFSSAYLIVNSTIQDIYTKLTDDGFQNEFSERKPYCQVEKVLTKDDNRIPYVKLKTVKLKKVKDIYHCRPVVQEITYLEKEPEFNKAFQQKLYRIKQKKFIVAFEAVHV